MTDNDFEVVETGTLKTLDEKDIEIMRLREEAKHMRKLIVDADEMLSHHGDDYGLDFKMWSQSAACFLDDEFCGDPECENCYNKANSAHKIP